MRIGEPALVYRARPGVQFAVEADGLLLRDPVGPRLQFVGYPQAAVWDLVSRGYRADRVVALLAAIAGVSEDSARELLRRTLDGWVEDGFLTQEATTVVEGEAAEGPGEP